MEQRFRNRAAAGEALADRLVGLDLASPVVLALPRGGVPVALPVARRLAAPLDLIMVRKIGAPGHEELAIGAVVGGDPPDVVWTDHVPPAIRHSAETQDRLVAEKIAQIEERRRSYLGGRKPIPLAGRDAIVIDDGIATGATMRAALVALGRREPASITVAVPVAPADVLARIRPLVDRVLCLSVPEPFYAVGAHYVDFGQTSDAEVRDALAAIDAEQETRP